MTDHKFTDDEVIHHLDCYENLGYRWCGYAITLINRQRAELEDLREIVFMDRSEAIKNLKSEAIKEFAQRLRKRARMPLGTLYGTMVYLKDIDTLVKEMTEGKND